MSDHKELSESTILAQCLEWLAIRRVFAWRNNTGAVKVDGRYLRYGHPGSSDILGVLPDGRFLAVETKAQAGRQSKAQKLFQRMVEKNGGLYVLARNTTDLERAIGQNPCLAPLNLDL